MPTTMFSAAVTAPGTPQRLTSITVPPLPTVSGILSGTITPRGNSITFQAAIGNAGVLYIGGPAMNVAAKTGIAFALAAGSASAPVDCSPGTTDVADFFIDTAGAAGDKVFVSVVG